MGPCLEEHTLRTAIFFKRGPYDKTGSCSEPNCIFTGRVEARHGHAEFPPKSDPGTHLIALHFAVVACMRF